MQFIEIQQLIEKEQPKITTKNREELNKLLLEAYKKRDLPNFIQLIQNGANENLNVGGFSEKCPILLKAALDGEIDFVCALALLGANTFNAIRWCINSYKKEPRLQNTLTILFDAAALGCSIGSIYLEDSNNNLFNLFTHLSQLKIDLEYFNFIGLSYQGHPLTAQLLKEQGIKLNGKGIFTEADINNISDKFRQEILQGYLNVAIKEYGKLENNGILNFISLQKSAETGNERAVITRINAGWNLRNSKNEGHDIVSHLDKAMQGAVNADSPIIADLIISNFILNINKLNKKDKIKNLKERLKETLFEIEHKALIQGKSKIVEYLQNYFDHEKMDELSPDEDQYSYTRLHFAACRNDVVLVKHLIAKYPKMVHASIWSTDSLPGKPLLCAIKHHASEEVINLLLNTDFEQYKSKELIKAIQLTINANYIQAISLIKQKKPEIFSIIEQKMFLKDILQPLLNSQIEITDKINFLTCFAENGIDFKQIPLINTIEAADDYDSQKQESEEKIKIKKIRQLVQIIKFFLSQNNTLASEIPELNKYLAQLFVSSKREIQIYDLAIKYFFRKSLINAQILFDYGINEKNKWAIKNALLFGANINQKGKNGYTALHTILIQQSIDTAILKLLLDYRADLEIPNDNNQKPTDLLKLILEKKENQRGQKSYYYTEEDHKIDHIKKCLDYINYVRKDIERDNILKDLNELIHSNNHHQIEKYLPNISLLCKSHQSHILVRRFVRDLILNDNENLLILFAKAGFNFSQRIDQEPFVLPTGVRPLPIKDGWISGNYDKRFDICNDNTCSQSPTSSIISFVKKLDDDNLRFKLCSIIYRAQGGKNDLHSLTFLAYNAASLFCQENEKLKTLLKQYYKDNPDMGEKISDEQSKIVNQILKIAR